MAENVVETLNGFLRGEISAVETYRQAIEKLSTSPTKAQLEDCRRSHEERVVTLRDQVVRHGGKPADGSGAWGTFASLIEGGAKLFGEKAAIAALEEGEDRGVKMYRTDVSSLDAATRAVIEQQVVPAQTRTHESMSRLKHSYH